jgi:predicted transcriptional regulator
MATPFPFTAGQVLTAAELNAITELPINAKTANHTLVAADAGARVQMTNAGATTITVDDAVFVAGQSVFIYNAGVGSCTIVAWHSNSYNRRFSSIGTIWGWHAFIHKC